MAPGPLALKIITFKKTKSMKTKILLGFLSLSAVTLIAAEDAAKEEVLSAAKKLKENYSWKSTVDAGTFNTITEGKTDKDGLASLSMKTGDTTREAFVKGGKGAVKSADEGWQSLSELETASGGGRGRQFMLRRLQNFKAPADEVARLVSKTKEIKKEGDVYSGELTEAGAKELLAFGRRTGSDAPEPKGAKGSVKFWTKDGLLSKYELKQQGTLSFNGQDRDIDVTTTVEIKEVGTTKFEVPDEA